MTASPTKLPPEGGSAEGRRRPRCQAGLSPRPLLAPLPPQLIDPRFAIDDPLIRPATQKTRLDDLRAGHRGDLQGLIELPIRPLLPQRHLNPDSRLSWGKPYGELDLKLPALGDPCLQVDDCHRSSPFMEYTSPLAGRRMGMPRVAPWAEGRCRPHGRWGRG